MDDAELLSLLKRIDRELRAVYPITNNYIDARLAITVGWLLGCLYECFEAVAEDRNLRLTRMRGGDPERAND